MIKIDLEGDERREVGVGESGLDGGGWGVRRRKKEKKKKKRKKVSACHVAQFEFQRRKEKKKVGGGDVFRSREVVAGGNRPGKDDE